MTWRAILLFVCSLLAAAWTVSAQDQCAKKLDELPQPPELRGFRLGMTYGYDKSFKWQALGEFVAGMSKALNVSAAWKPKGPGQQLTCEAFSLFASMIAGSPSLRLIVETAQETIATRREEAAAAAEEMEKSEGPKTPVVAEAKLPVIGDRQSKLYYQLDCSAALSVPEAKRIIFQSKEEAEKAGYKQAKKCS